MIFLILWPDNNSRWQNYSNTTQNQNLVVLKKNKKKKKNEWRFLNTTDSFCSVFCEILAASCLWLRGQVDRYHRTNHHPLLFLGSGAKRPGIVISADTALWRGTLVVCTSTWFCQFVPGTFSFHVAVSSSPWLFESIRAPLEYSLFV